MAAFRFTSDLLQAYIIPTAISSDSRPPKFEMLDINICFWHLSAVASSITSQIKIRQIRIRMQHTNISHKLST